MRPGTKRAIVHRVRRAIDPQGGLKLPPKLGTTKNERVRRAIDPQGGLKQAVYPLPPEVTFDVRRAIDPQGGLKLEAGGAGAGPGESSKGH